MTSGYRTDPEEMRRLIDTAARIDRNLEGHLLALSRNTSALQQHWTGGAAQAHKAHHDAWTRAAHEMRAALAALRDATVRAHANYHGNVTHQQRMWPS